MGGRGAYYSKKSESYKSREYDAVGRFEGIKMIEARAGTKMSKSTLPMHSLTSSAYILVDGDNIRKIGYYKNHNLVRSVDLDDPSQEISAHIWETIPVKNESPIVRRKEVPGRDNHYPLTEEEKAFVIRLLGKDLRGKRFYNDNGS